MAVLNKTSKKLTAAAIAGAMSIGYNLRPADYRGVNDGWLCVGCGAISKGVTALMRQHGECNVQSARALVRAEKCL